jgi:hypothetical protein
MRKGFLTYEEMSGYFVIYVKGFPTCKGMHGYLKGMHGYLKGMHGYLKGQWNQIRLQVFFMSQFPPSP